MSSEPSSPDAAPPEHALTVSGYPPALAIAGAVSGEEELQCVQQIALISRWMRLFSKVAEGKRPPGGPPRGMPPA